MTMKRDAKVEALATYADTLVGRTHRYSSSPKQIAQYGRYLPAELAAGFGLRVDRAASVRTRETWALARIRFAEATRHRTTHLPTAYVPRHAR